MAIVKPQQPRMDIDDYEKCVDSAVASEKAYKQYDEYVMKMKRADQLKKEEEAQRYQKALMERIEAEYKKAKNAPQESYSKEALIAFFANAGVVNPASVAKSFTPGMVMQRSGVNFADIVAQVAPEPQSSMSREQFDQYLSARIGQPVKPQKGSLLTNFELIADVLWAIRLHNTNVQTKPVMPMVVFDGGIKANVFIAIGSLLGGTKESSYYTGDRGDPYSFAISSGVTVATHRDLNTDAYHAKYKVNSSPAVGPFAFAFGEGHPHCALINCTTTKDDYEVIVDNSYAERMANALLGKKY